MSDLESRRLALYTGLTERLGPELADMLMSFLPATSQVATSQDIQRVDQELDRLNSEVGAMRQEMRDELRHLSQRIDRLQQTTLAGFVAMIAALLAAGFLT